MNRSKITVSVLALLCLMMATCNSQEREQWERFSFDGWTTAIGNTGALLRARKSERKETWYQVTLQGHLEDMFRCWLMCELKNGLVQNPKLRFGIRQIIKDEFTMLGDEFDPSRLHDPCNVLRDTEGMGESEKRAVFERKMKFLMSGQMNESSLETVEKYLEQVKRFHAFFRDYNWEKERDKRDAGGK